MCVSIIVACDPCGVIGKQGKLPWRLPEDLQFFRSRTLGTAIIMGKNTWESLPTKPLDGRANIVLCRSEWHANTKDDGPFYYSDIKNAIDDINEAIDGPLAKYRFRDINIIGGARIYREALERDLVDRIVMSKIKKEYDGDVKFPDLPDKWKITATDHREGFDIVYLSNKQRLTESH